MMRLSNLFIDRLQKKRHICWIIPILTGLTILSGWPFIARAQDPVPLDPIGLTFGGSVAFDSAWGDVDNDGDLDFVVANGGNPTTTSIDGTPNHLFLNENGHLSLTPDWISNEENLSISVAWGDVNNDGFLDLAVGNDGEPDQLYLNQGGQLNRNASWSSNLSTSTTGLAWADVDGNGFLDLVAGTFSGRSYVYLNQNGTLNSAPDWSAANTRNTRDIALGDMNGDGLLDLALGNENAPNEIYLGNGLTFAATPIWSSINDGLDAQGLRWGDVDGDGDLDLAVANGFVSVNFLGQAIVEGQTNQIYFNDGSQLQTTPGWTSVEADLSFNLAWADVDNDGDLDLAVANGQPDGAGKANLVYQNEGGSLQTSAAWSSQDDETTYALAWGDIDHDGDLDLGFNNLYGASNKVHINNLPPLQTTASWTSMGDVDNGWSIAWGDVNGDGFLDLAVGNTQGPSSLYLNNNGQLSQMPDWQSNDEDSTASIAWGDIDGDGDLDLATSAGELTNLLDSQNKVYLNVDGMLQTTPFWRDTDGNNTGGLAWGDIDGDGDLDLAVANAEGFDLSCLCNVAHNKVYLNTGSTLETEASWLSTEEDISHSVAWGDVDGDGDLDLAVANRGSVGFDGAPNRLYYNEGGRLQASAGWSSNDSDRSISLAWGDVDGDGDLDLAVGNDEAPNKIYRNINGQLETNAAWFSSDTDSTLGLAWGDMDGDGDLDLVAGNHSGPNKIYRNQQGVLERVAIWQSNDTNHSQAVAVGDVDNDGDLDLAVSHGDSMVGGSPPVLYLNPGRNFAPMVNNPSYLALTQPGTTAAAYFYATPEIIASPTITITYLAYDPEGEPIAEIMPEYSENGGGVWKPATSGIGGDDLYNITTSPTGQNHTFIWQANADLIKSDNARFRLRARQTQRSSPIAWGSLDAQSPPFRVAAPWYIQVTDAQTQPVAGIPIYADGQLITETLNGITLTNQAGLLSPGPLPPGTQLVALKQVHERPTGRGAHDGWAYRTYITNIAVDALGNTTAFTVTEPGPQTLTVRPENTLIVFNILVSIEWDAEESYIQDIKAAMEQASHYLYDVTDGQMTFGQVAIYDNAEYWQEADIQIYAKVPWTPLATINGIYEDEADRIRVSRFWNGSTSAEGNWREPNGFRTLVHEFGHYGLGLYDEYEGYYKDAEGNLSGKPPAHCTGPENRDTPADPDSTWGSIMDHHYTTSELVDVSRWTDDCKLTRQHLKTEALFGAGEADWETVLRLYQDPTGLDRWRLISPDERAGAEQAVPGPHSLPPSLPFPKITTINQGPQDPPVKHLQVCYQGNPYNDQAWVILQVNDDTIAQGYTNEAGQRDILGAVPSARLQISTQDGTLVASRPAPLTSSIVIHLEPIPAKTQKQLLLEAEFLAKESLTVDEALAFARQGLGSTTFSDDLPPYIRLWPTSSGNTLDGLRVVVNRTTPQDALVYTLSGPNDAGIGSTLTYSSTANNFQDRTGFIPADKAGHARVLGVHEGHQFIDLNVDYRIHQADNINPADLFSNDGNLRLLLDTNALPINTVHFLTASPWGLPGPLPPGLTIAGEAYEITASANVTNLNKPAILTLRYDQTISETMTDLAIYRWDFGAKNWEHLGGDYNLAYQEVSTTTTRLGLYALLGSRKPAHRPTTNTNPLFIEPNLCGLPALPTSNQAPHLPSSPTPRPGSVDMATDLTLNWQAGDPDNDPLTYTVSFSDNNPPAVITVTTKQVYTPTSLNAGTTYYWRITASDGVSDTIGPIWHFTTNLAPAPGNHPPYLPTNPMPANDATAVPTNITFSWQSDDPDDDEVTYTVALGLSNPPPMVTSTTLSTYNASGLQANTTYYWQITATDGISTTTGAIWQFTTGVEKSSPNIYLPLVIKQ